jgi:hypothetical protein
MMPPLALQALQSERPGITAIIGRLIRPPIADFAALFLFNSASRAKNGATFHDFIFVLGQLKRFVLQFGQGTECYFGPASQTGG